MSTVQQLAIKSVRGHLPPVSTTLGQADSGRIVLIGSVLLVPFWFLVKSMGGMGQLVITAVFVSAIGLATLLLAVKRVPDALAVIVFVAILEPMFKQQALFVPYLTLQYMSVVWAMLLLLVLERVPRFGWPVFFYGIYVLLEILGIFYAESFEYARAVLLPSVAVLLFATIAMQIRLPEAATRRVLDGVILAGVSMGTVLAYGYLMGDLLQTQWLTESSYASSGGMGPVQVSFVLAVAVFVSLWSSLRGKKWENWLYRGIAVVLGFLMIMTFSRGGLALLLGALLVYVAAGKIFSWKVFVGLLVAAVAGLVVFQIGTNVAGEALIERYSELSTTNRAELFIFGWEIFKDAPLFGTGTGDYYVEIPEFFGRTTGAHNELIRAAAEHGAPGLFSWLAFVASGAWLAMKHPRTDIRGLRMALFAVFVASTFHNGLKLLIQPVLVLLAFAIVGSPSTMIRLMRTPKKDVPTKEDQLGDNAEDHA